MARAMLRDLSDAARDGRLTRWETNFVASLQHQAARPRWRPSPRQNVVIRRLIAELGEAEATLLDPDDTVDARAQTGGRAPNSRANRPTDPAGMGPASKTRNAKHKE